MARLPYLDPDDLPAEHRDLLDRNINLLRAMVHNPDCTRAFRGLGDYIRHDSHLDPRLRELAILQVGYITRAPYEWSHHIRIGRTFGVSDGDIRVLIDETEGRTTTIDDTTKAVLRAAREMTAEGLSDETHAAVAAFLDPRDLVDLLVTIAVYIGVVSLLDALKIDVEPDYQDELNAFPLPAK
jgi:alkylhydroperoxidase family enzyme